MEIILLEDVPSLGKVGDLVRASDGYARNYLIPNKLAIKATLRAERSWNTKNALPRTKWTR